MTAYAKKSGSGSSLLRFDDPDVVVQAVFERAGEAPHRGVFPVPDRVVGPRGRTIAYTDQEMARLTAEGMDQLRRIETQLDGTPVESVVRFGEPAEEILLEAEAFDADLVALATSVRSRLRSALLPGVAERVARKAPVPTLLLRVSRPSGRRR